MCLCEELFEPQEMSKTLLALWGAMFACLSPVGGCVGGTHLRTSSCRKAACRSPRPNSSPNNRAAVFEVT